MRTRWVIAGQYVGRVVARGETRHCFGFDFTHCDWHRHGVPVDAHLRVSTLSGVPFEMRIYRSLSLICVGRGTVQSTQPVSVDLCDDELRELSDCAGEPYALDTVLMTPDGLDIATASMAVTLELQTEADVATRAA